MELFSFDHEILTPLLNLWVANIWNTVVVKRPKVCRPMITLVLQSHKIEINMQGERSSEKNHIIR